MKNLWNEVLLFAAVLTVFICNAFGVTLGWTLLYVGAVLILPIGHRDFKEIEKECGVSEGILERVWKWAKKTYDWRDVRDLAILPIVLAISAATLQQVYNLKEKTVLIGMGLIYLPVIVVHAWKDYNKIENKSK